MWFRLFPSQFQSTGMICKNDAGMQIGGFSLQTGCGSHTNTNEREPIRGVGKSFPILSPLPRGEKKRQPQKVTPQEKNKRSPLDEPITCNNPIAFYEDGDLKGRLCPSVAEQYGLTIVDLSDNWAPFLFSESSELGPVGQQPYRSTYIALADERLGVTNQGAPRARYLELYGIFPTFRVLRDRLGDTKRHACHDAIEDESFEELSEDMRPFALQSKNLKRKIQRTRYLENLLKQELSQRGLSFDSISQLENESRWSSTLDQYGQGKVLVRAVEAMQSHL